MAARPRGPAKTPHKTRLTIRLPVATAETLYRVVELQGGTVNSVLTAAVESYLNPAVRALLDHHTTKGSK